MFIGRSAVAETMKGGKAKLNAADVSSIHQLVVECNDGASDRKLLEEKVPS
jgi:hypothetical protein